MEKCIRNEDGSPISGVQWRAIKLSARMIAQAQLLSLPSPNLSKPIARTKVYYKQHHLKAWLNAIHELEERQPLLFLCEGSWKAEHVLGASLLAHASEAKQKTKRQRATTEEVDEGMDVNDEVENPPQLNCSDHISQEEEARAESSKKRRRVSASPSHPKKKKKSSPSAPLQDRLSSLLGSGSVAPPTSTIAQPTPATVAPPTSTIAHPTPATEDGLTISQPSPAVEDSQTDYIDVSFIRVEALCKYVYHYLMLSLLLFSQVQV